MYWLIVISIYWLCAVRLLVWASPVFVDGSGATASFYWGNHIPSASLLDYQRIWTVRLPFLYPYWYGASIITFEGCVLTGWIMQILNPKRLHFFTTSSIAVLCLLLLTAGISDLGIVLGIWRGPMMYVGMRPIFVGLKVIIPMALIGGLLQIIAPSHGNIRTNTTLTD